MVITLPLTTVYGSVTSPHAYRLPAYCLHAASVGCACVCGVRACARKRVCGGCVLAPLAVGRWPVGVGVAPRWAVLYIHIPRSQIP